MNSPSSNPNNITRRCALKTFGMVAAGTLIGSSLALTGCNARSPRGGHPTEYYISPYDWNGLVWNGDRLAFYEDGALSSRWGIDVSEHQHAIDWAQVASSGVEFAFVRIGNRGATEGVLGVDEYFMQNAVGASEQGISVSGYFFSQAITEQEAIEEAQFALAQVEQARQMGCEFTAIAYDHERVNVEGARANDISGEQLSANTAAFCDSILMAGYDTLIYGNKRDLLRIDYDMLKNYPVWFAEYDAETPSAPFDFTIWQYSNAGSIPGVSTRVDLNLWLV